MKVTLEFCPYEDSDALDAALNGAKYKSQLDEIWQEVFRPYRKHGYVQKNLQECIEANPEVAETIIEGLIEIYQGVVHEED
jgi:hypothetical protein